MNVSGDTLEDEVEPFLLRSELILCRTSEADGVVTAGGVAAWHDLVFYLIARFCGRQKSIETAKVFLLSGHEDGQADGSERPPKCR